MNGVVRIAVLLTLIAATAAVNASPDAPTRPWRLVWADEFDHTTLDGRSWRAEHSTYGDGNGELACLTPDAVVVRARTLRISATATPTTCPGGIQRGYRSGFVSTRAVGRFLPRYGRFEIRARVPHGQGLWPAFWLRHRAGAAQAEVDVLEVFHSQRPGSVSHAVHFPARGRVNAFQASAPLEELPPLGHSGDWHVVSVEIAPDGATGVRFTFRVDGTITGDWVDPDPSWRDLAPADGTWDLAVNLAVGGTWVGHPDRALGWLPAVGRCARTGRPPAGDPSSCPTDGIRLAAFPALYEIDHVRVWARR